MALSATSKYRGYEVGNEGTSALDLLDSFLFAVGFSESSSVHAANQRFGGCICKCMARSKSIDTSLQALRHPMSRELQLCPEVIDEQGMVFVGLDTFASTASSGMPKQETWRIGPLIRHDYQTNQQLF
jgi:hypothetical protein